MSTPGGGPYPGPQYGQGSYGSWGGGQPPGGPYGGPAGPGGQPSYPPQQGGNWPPPPGPPPGGGGYPGGGGFGPGGPGGYGPGGPGGFGPGGPGGFPPPGPPGGGGGSGRTVALVVVGALVVAAIVIGAVLALGGDDKDDKAGPTLSPTGSSSVSGGPTRASSGPPTPTATRTRSAVPTPTATVTDDSVQSIPLSPGDCVNQGLTKIEKVSCSSPHDMEHVKSFDLPAGPWPGDTSVTDQADAGCKSAVDAVIARQSNASQLTDTFLYPLQETWEAGDREVQCFVMMRDESKLTSKLK